MTIESMSHILESISHLMGQVAAAVLLLIGIILLFAIITGAKVRQDRKRRGAVDWTEEMPYIPRRAMRCEADGCLREHGFKVEDQ